jgi:poly(A) polymerase
MGRELPQNNSERKDISVDYAKYGVILETLNQAGHKAFYVGGLVRNLKLGLAPKDIDITTSATPGQVKELFPCAAFVGAHFGVSLVKVEDEMVEVATFRTDGAYLDARRPSSVKFTTNVLEDLERRDFTVNALLMDVNGNVQDFVGGYADLENKLIRAIGDPDKRFKEDALRLLRAVRFACNLDFTIEANTFEAIRRNAALVLAVSAERLADELVGILTSGRAARGIELLQDSGLLAYILPEINRMRGVSQNPKFHPEGDVYQHTIGLLERLERGCSKTLALAALLHDVGKPGSYALKDDGQPSFYGHEELGEEVAGEVLRRLKLPGEVIDIVKSHVRQHMAFMSVRDMRKAKQLRFVGQPNFAELLELHKLDTSAALGNMEEAEFVEELLRSTPEQVVHPVRLLTGRDLIDLGLKPGPQFKAILEEAMVEQLEGRMVTREQALRFASGKAQSL